MTVRGRLLAAFAYVLVLVLVALEVPLAFNLARRIRAEVKNDAASQAFIVAAGASGRMDQPGRLRQLARESAADLGARVIVVDGRGRVKADSAGSGTANVSYASRPEIRVALDGRRAQGERHSDTLGKDLLYTAVPITNESRTVGAVRVTQDVGEVGRRIRNSILALVAIGGFTLVIGLGLAWLLASSLSRPLRSLAATARRVEAGDLSARAEVTGPKEQKEVAVAFNDMTDRVERVLAAQRDFVANASHQLRTPLTGLRLRLEAARAQGGADAELEAAEQEVERLASLLTSLLTLAREGERPAGGRPVSLADSASRAQERWTARAEQRGHNLRLAGNGDATIEASEDDVAIVLDNLIENALHYSPSPSTVTVDWGQNGREAWIAVLDEGPGLAPGEDTELFERFARGSAGRGGPAGTGLGLAIVDTLARRWRGRASMENRPEGGTRAEVRLPTRG